MAASNCSKKYTPPLFMAFLGWKGCILILLPHGYCINTSVKEKTGKKWGGVLLNSFLRMKVEQRLPKSFYLQVIRQA